MKDICIVYNKDNKNLVKKLTTKLESDGISCMVSPRDYRSNVDEEAEKAVTNSKILLLVVDDKSASNKEQITALEYALENDISVIPFVTNKVKSDLYSEYFFYSFSWVDAYEDSFEDAYEVLTDAYEELSGENTSAKKANKKKKSGDSSQKVMSKPALIGISLIVFAIVGYFAYGFFSNEKEAKRLVGEWYISDYQDNMRRSPADSIAFVTQTIPNLKSSALLIFNDDNTFERRGFTPEPQIGTWNFDATSSILKLVPYGAKAAASEIQLRNVSQNTFTIVAEEQLEDSVQQADGKFRKITKQSVTKIRFVKKM